MADAIERLVRERDLAETLSRSGLAVAARSSWPHLRPLWQQLFG
jgi:hypothetical protein